MAKGLTAGYMPLGAVGVRLKIKDFFETNPVGWGTTYSFHPIGMACSYATLKYYIDNDILKNVNDMAPILREGM